MNYRFLLVALTIMFVSACSRYQLLDYATPQNQVLNDGYYIFENDSIKFTYRFYGQNTIVALYIENKTDAPIFIDWQHSGLVYNGKAVQLQEYRTRTTTIITQNPPVLLGNRSEFQTEHIRHDLNANMLLPTAQFKQDSLVILRARKIDLEETPPTTFQVINDNTGNSHRSVHIFNHEQSPMRFQFFFTITFGISQAVSKSFTHPFYLRNLEESKNRPKKIQNVSYIER